MPYGPLFFFFFSHHDRQGLSSNEAKFHIKSGHLCTVKKLSCCSSHGCDRAYGLWVSKEPTCDRNEIQFGELMS